MKILKTICSLLIFCSTMISFAQDKEVIVETHKLSETVYMLIGQGGNLGVSVGPDGVFMIDDQYPHTTPKILAAIKELGDKQIQFLVNTHHHGDHTGGNENMAKEGAKIIAHDNVYKRIKMNDKQSDQALPVITFNDKLSLYINGEKVFIFHVDHAHTDGDALLYFTKSNVLHTGDTFFNGWYPYIDLGSGGSVNGYIEAVKKALILIDDDTKIIPGHGKLSNKAEYAAFLSMLETLRDIVLGQIKSGKTEEEVTKSTGLTKKYDDLGYSWSFISSEKIRRTFYRSLKKYPVKNQNTN